MRISDWSSDVCSSDLLVAHRLQQPAGSARRQEKGPIRHGNDSRARQARIKGHWIFLWRAAIRGTRNSFEQRERRLVSHLSRCHRSQVPASGAARAQGEEGGGRWGYPRGEGERPRRDGGTHTLLGTDGRQEGRGG